MWPKEERPPIRREREVPSFDGLGLNPGEGMNVCKCIVPSRHGDTLNRPLLSPGCSSQNWDRTEQNRAITYMVLKAKANDRRKNLAVCQDEFRRS
ncbi:hypothetical protein TNCV_3062631 [Trichonephila clavipes]|nr:hypothetical protein TNCV_3062631 [Trichonephila clavipes]